MTRNQQLRQWLDGCLNTNDYQCEPASEDASFRQYHRVTVGADSYIVMDAPPEHEDCRPFVQVQKMLSEHQVHVPQIKAFDATLGFMLLSDFGQQLYLDHLHTEQQVPMYQKAIDELLQIQQVPTTELPVYDHNLLSNELQLFTDWFIDHHLNVSLSQQQHAVLGEAFDRLIGHAQEQPQVFVHRDYHSRNLMWVNERPGVIDFQDAVRGPLTYDLVSLLKDCYIRLAEDTRKELISYYLQHMDLALDCDEAQFMRWFDLMGMQRHLKATGIFSRLNYRDGKPGYLKDIPRTLGYVLDMCSQYAEFNAFGQLLNDIIPTLKHHP
jgi:aminoglycoside/choline kinase family phosphotransferase